MENIQQFLRNLNEAFVKSDSAYVLENVTDNVRWHIIGDQTINGKKEFEKVLKEMETDEAFELRIDNIISEQTKAVVNGSIRPKTEEETATYHFCDIYKFMDEGEHKISEITSYVVEENQ